MPHKTEKEVRMNYNEIGFLKFCNHPNIVKYHRSYLNEPESELWVCITTPTLIMVTNNELGADGVLGGWYAEGSYRQFPIFGITHCICCP